MPFKLRSSTSLCGVQALRKDVLRAAVVLAIALLAVVDSRWPEDSLPHEAIEVIGLGLIILCIFGRTWCSIYIGGMKRKKLVVHGPYSVSRNPLYVFSIIGAAGVGALFGSLTVAAAAGFIAWFVFYLVVLKEEKALSGLFGKAFGEYCESVPRFFPDFSKWRDLAVVEVRPRIIVKTFKDSSIFLVTILLVEGFEYLEVVGLLPALIRLP